MIIKKNIATECCITNGACGVVYGWHSSVIAPGKQTLDVVFVKLIDPPKPIHLDGLPENVVPISKQSVTVRCLLPNDHYVNVIRQQVLLLLNFALTDYGSQGKMRKTNACYLVDSSNSQSVYTSLSRSSSAKDTIILQGFNPYVIQGGLSGYLRQEFRELELLDQISKL